MSRYTGNLRVYYFVLSPGGALLAESSDQLIMALRQPSYEKAIREGVVPEKELEVQDKGEALRVKLVVYDAKNDRLGVGLVNVK